MMMNYFLMLLAVGGVFFTLIGMLTVVYWVRPARAPADSSNRINNIASWWIGLTRPDVLATSWKFFRQDVLDNIEDVGKDDTV